MKRWPTVRAALLAMHVVAVVLLSLPSPTRLADRSRWASQRTQRELELWARRLGWTTPQLEARLWRLAQGYLRVRQVVTTPVTPYAHVAGTGQSWGMFRSPQRRPGVLVVEIADGDTERGTDWRVVYRSRSPERTYLRDKLDHNRMRKLVARCARDGQLFDHIAHFVAREVARDQPEAKVVRVRLERFDSLPPARVRAGEQPAYRTARSIEIEL